jgi:hypothetical protein
MTETEIRQAIKDAPKGANVFVSWERNCKLRAAFRGLPLTKHTRMLCRIAVRYDTKEQTKVGRADGTLPAENAGMRGKEWIDYPTLIRYIKSQKIGLRLESGTFKVKAVRTYKLDGQPVAFEDYKHAMLASEYPKPKEGQLTFDVSIDAIISVHKSNEVEEAEEEVEF